MAREDDAEKVAGALLLVEGLVELLERNEPPLEQELPERLAFGRGGHNTQTIPQSRSGSQALLELLVR